MTVKRIMLKLSGEALMGTKSGGFCATTIARICQDLYEVYNLGYQIAMVVGGGNICRGSSVEGIGIERANADYMGMLATVINALAIQGKLESMGLVTRVQSSIPMMTVAEPYIRRKAIRHMDKGRIVIFAGGTGSPFFTTDTCAVLRAIETNCDVLLKGTQVDGVYASDPRTDPNAVRYDKVTYGEVLSKDLKVMDATAIAMARDNKLRIKVFNLSAKRALAGALDGTGVCTTVC